MGRAEGTRPCFVTVIDGTTAEVMEENLSYWPLPIAAQVTATHTVRRTASFKSLR